VIAKKSGACWVAIRKIDGGILEEPISNNQKTKTRENVKGRERGSY
jgi:hypothetical protein